TKPTVKSAARVVAQRSKPTASPDRHSTKPRKVVTSSKPTPKPPVRIATNPQANGAHPKPVAVVRPPVAPPVKPNLLPKPAAPAKPVPPKVEYKPIAPARIDSVIPPEKDLSTGKGGKPGGGVTKDRIVLMVPDPFWLHTYWELSYQSVQRAEAALKQDWHGAKPIIRLFDVTSQDTTSTSETPVRDILVHGECNTWYLEVT